MITAPAHLVDRYRRAGWWGDRTLDDCLRAHVAMRPGHEAVVDPPNRLEVTGSVAHRLTWAELGDRVDRMACALLQAGLRRDDVIVVQLPNTWELPALYLACARLGIIASPVPAQYREHEIGAVVEQTAARAIVTAARIGKADHLAIAHAVAAAHPLAILAIGGAPHPALDLDEALARPADLAMLAAYVAAHPVSADDAVCLCWTSGSEGRPKGVPRSHNQWLAGAALMVEAAHLDGDSRILNGRPFVTVGAMTGTFIPWLVTGGTLVNHHPFSLSIFARQILDERIDFTATAPAMLAKLLDEPVLQGLPRLGRLRAITSGSAPLPAQLVRTYRDRFGIELINVFGSTEGTLLMSAAQEVPDPEQRASLFPRWGAAGLVWSFSLSRLVETMLVDPASGAVITAPGVPGELRHRGPLAFTGYFNAPDLDAAAFDAEGFVRTGDLFEIAGADGRFYRFVGRMKDIVVRGGMNISALEVETLVAAHPAVAEAAAIGVPDPILGERLCIAIACQPGHDLALEALNRFLRDEKRVAVFKLPEKLLALAALPRTAVGKVDKKRLGALAAGS